MMMHMNLIRSLYNIQPEHRGCVLTIGNFDGVHLGHQQLIKYASEKARKMNVPLIVMTFEPHPAEFFAKTPTVPRLSNLREKCQALWQSGADFILLMPFNQKLADVSASDFIDMIHANLQPLSIIVGDDFHFGSKRQGNIALLQERGKHSGFSAESLPTIMQNGERISSTRVRKALQAGDHELVKQLLGGRYSMLGKIRHGDHLGRQWGFPTANIFLHRRLSPVHGVYTVQMSGIADEPLPGVANVGNRPTVDGTKTLLEVHLLDFNQDIYGCSVKVEFCEKLREEIRYPTIELLREQIAKDVVIATNYFKQHGVL